MTNGHYSVLLNESVDALVTDSSGVYVDGTFGRGGHSRAILSQLSDQGRLIAFDKDPEAVAVGEVLQQSDPRFRIVHGSFADMASVVGKVDGVVLDLGVSSPQLDVAERGFSFLNDGPLDMRMNNTQGRTAADWVNHAEESELMHVFFDFGEERYSRRIARAIVAARAESPIETTGRFAKIITEAHPKWEKGKNPATRVFQAVRIYINSELDDLKNGLDAAHDCLQVGGRLVVISFHSLEDRIVKRFIRDKVKGKQFPAGIPVTDDMLERTMVAIGRAAKAGENELEENNRSRSAVLRIAEKI